MIIRMICVFVTLITSSYASADPYYYYVCNYKGPNGEGDGYEFYLKVDPAQKSLIFLSKDGPSGEGGGGMMRVCSKNRQSYKKTVNSNGTINFLGQIKPIGEDHFSIADLTLTSDMMTGGTPTRTIYGMKRLGTVKTTWHSGSMFLNWQRQCVRREDSYGDKQGFTLEKFLSEKVFCKFEN